MTITILLIILSIAIYLFLKKAAKGPVRTLTQLENVIQELLDRGFNDGFLIIQHTKSDRFIQYGKYILNKNEYGIELGFPDAEWSHDYYKALKQHCDKNDIQYREERLELSFINIDFKKDCHKAYEFACFILTDIFELSEDEKYHTSLNNASA